MKVIRNIHPEEFIFAVLSDDLSSGKVPHDQIELITSADLSSAEENDKRRKLLQTMNGAFGAEINYLHSCQIVELSKEDFLSLLWCPCPSRPDEVDKMTGNTRKLQDLLNYLETVHEHEENEITKYRESLFNHTADITEKKRRIFLYHLSDLSIIDGNHRSGTILTLLSKKKGEEYFPLIAYMTKISG